jgi:putative transposase
MRLSILNNSKLKDAINKDNAKNWGCAGSIQDSLTDLLRSGARALIQQAVEAELQAFLNGYQNVTDVQGRRTVVRNGYLPERDIVTGVVNVDVKTSKERDRSGGGIKFNSSLVPPYIRKAKRVGAALPWLHYRIRFRLKPRQD